MAVCPILNSDVKIMCPNCKKAKPNTIPPHTTKSVRINKVSSGLKAVTKNNTIPTSKIKISILQSLSALCKLGGQKK